jgi:streptogramin lyase
MQAANNQYYAANPAAAVSQNAPAPSKADTKATGGSSDPRVLAWASKPENAMLRELAPSTYAMRLAEYKKAIGAK